MDEVEALKRRIEQAFAEVPYPGDDKIVTHKCWECDEVAGLFKGLHWSKVPVAALSNRGGPLPLLSPEAFQFYLPAFLIASIDYVLKPETPEVSLLGMLMSPEAKHASLPRADQKLSKPPDEGDREYRATRVGRLSADQLSAVKDVLGYLRKRESMYDFMVRDIDRALQALF